MGKQDYSQPSELALNYLKERIKEDKSLSDDIRTAVLIDLASGSETKFEELKKILEAGEDEAD